MYHKTVPHNNSKARWGNGDILNIGNTPSNKFRMSPLSRCFWIPSPRERSDVWERDKGWGVRSNCNSIGEFN